MREEHSDSAGRITRLRPHPLFFLYYINNLAELLSDFNTNALIADDVSILAVDEEKEAAERNQKETIDIVASWS